MNPTKMYKYITVSVFSALLMSFTPLTNHSMDDFYHKQKSYQRVKDAVKDKEEIVKKLLTDAGIKSTDINLYLRAFKNEQKLEVWAKEHNQSKYSLVQTYKFCNSSGVLGPKRKQGDLQIPEGFYHVAHFNPFSQFHLSLGINYPNNSDIKLGAKNPGGDIYIHGDCVTVGCIPISDDKIKELYLLSLYGKAKGDRNIPVNIFPFEFNETNWKHIKKLHKDDPNLIEFWKELEPGVVYFNQYHKLPLIKIDGKGHYKIN